MLKIRCSQIGKIMTMPRSKKEELSKTTIGYLQELIKEKLYGRRKEVHSKYMEKGIKCEDASIELYQKYTGDILLIKNEKQYDNDYLTGTPDVVLPDCVYEFKSSWDCFSFPLFDEEPPKDYYWQIQGYLALTGRLKAKLIFALINTPEEIVEKEIYYAHNGRDYDEKLAEEIKRKHNFDELPYELRIKEYEIARDDAAIDSIYSQVEKCRKYVESLNIKL
jgi:predicted phage-related endonuclease